MYLIGGGLNNYLTYTYPINLIVTFRLLSLTLYQILWQ